MGPVLAITMAWDGGCFLMLFLQVKEFLICRVFTPKRLVYILNARRMIDVVNTQNHTPAPNAQTTL